MSDSFKVTLADYELCERKLAAVEQERDSLRADLAAARYAIKINEATEGDLVAQLAEARKHTSDANRGAEVNAKVNQRLVREIAEARRQGDVIKQECIALRQAMAEIHVGLEQVYLKYKHLDYLRNRNNLDPWHECVRDFMRAVAVATGYEQQAAQQAKEGGGK